MYKLLLGLRYIRFWAAKKDILEMIRILRDRRGYHRAYNGRDAHPEELKLPAGATEDTEDLAEDAR